MFWWYSVTAFANLVQSCVLETDVIIWESWYALVMLTTHHHIMSWHVGDMAGLHNISPKFGACRHDRTQTSPAKKMHCCRLWAASCKLQEMKALSCSCTCQLQAMTTLHLGDINAIISPVWSWKFKLWLYFWACGHRLYLHSWAVCNITWEYRLQRYCNR